MPDAQIIIKNPAVNVLQKIVSVDVRGAAGAGAYDAWGGPARGTVNDFLAWLISEYGITITAAAGASVPLMAALAAIGSPAIGQTAYLYEEGREGWFKCKSYSSISDLISADTYNARSIQSATDATKAWERIVEDGVYHFTWWDVAFGDADNYDQLYNALFGEVIPNNVVFRLPPFEFVTSQHAFGERHNLRIEGYGPGLTNWAADPEEDGFKNLTIWGDNLIFRDFTITGNGDPAFANSSPCLEVGLGPDPIVYENWLFKNMSFDGGAIGLLVTASNDDTDIARPRGIDVNECRFRTKGQGASFFGVEDARLNDCELDMETSTPNNSNCGMRILGSKDVHVDNLNGVASGENGFYIAAMQRGTSGDTLRLQNENIYLKNGVISNALVHGILAEECLGDFVVDNYRFKASPAGTNASMGIRFETGIVMVDVQARFEKIHIKASFEGYHVYNYWVANNGGILADHCEIEQGLYVGNQCTDAGVLASLFSAPFGSPNLLEIHHNKVLQRSSGPIADNSGQAISCANQAGQIVRAFDNTLPEGTPTTGTLIGISGTGTVEGDLTNQRVYPANSYAKSGY